MTGPKTNERPGTRATLRGYQMSASKARVVLNIIRGEDVTTAREILAGHHPRSGRRDRQGPRLGRRQRRQQRRHAGRRALRLGRLRRRGHHHEALHPACAWTRRQDLQALQPHHGHRLAHGRRAPRDTCAPRAPPRPPCRDPSRRLLAPSRRPDCERQQARTAAAEAAEAEALEAEASRARRD